MINVVIPLAGPRNKFFPEDQYPYPVALIEVAGKTLIELTIENFSTLKDPNFIFIVNRDDCTKYHIDNTLRILTEGRCTIIKLDRFARGAACSVLIATEHIDNDIPLLIVNSDQVIEVSMDKVVAQLSKGDVGVAVFESVHPRWSYIRVDRNNDVIEAAEKRPISKMAIAGLYYFRNGKYFVDAAKSMIRKDANIKDVFYIAPAINELILSGMKIERFLLTSGEYHTFYTPQKIEEFERRSR